MEESFDRPTSNLKRKNFKSGGIGKIIENALNNAMNRVAFDTAFRLRKKGLSFQKIANQLCDEGHLTRRGKQFSKASVKQLYDRFLKYTNKDTGEFEEGYISINSNKLDHFGKLKILNDGKIKIEVNFIPFKEFDFFTYTRNLKKDQSISFEAFEIILKDYNNARERIVVSNYLHPFQITTSKEFDFLNTRYYNFLEDIIRDKKIRYDRFIHIPESLRNMYEPDFKELSKPFESIIMALKLMTSAMREHIESCFENCKTFKLIVLRIQRTYSNFATIDSNIIIEEEYLTSIEGYSFPNSISIHRAKENNEHNKYFLYIQNKKNHVYKPYFKEEGVIKKEVYWFVKNLVARVENQADFFEYIKMEKKPLELRGESNEALWDRVRIVLKIVDKYRKNIKNMTPNEESEKPFKVPFLVN